MSAKPPAPCDDAKLPSMPCASHAELMDAIVDIKTRVNDVHTALVGNPTLGHKGLVERVETIEKISERHDRKLLVWGSLATAAGAALATAKDFFTK